MKKSVKDKTEVRHAAPGKRIEEEVKSFLIGV